MSQQQAGQRRLTPEDQETGVLLSLAYLGQLTLAQLARLLLTSERTIQRRLTQDADSLAKRGLIVRVDRAGARDENGMPTRGVAIWRLTDEGHRSIRTHAQYPSNNLGHDVQYPARPAAIRKGRLEHDAMVAETVVCLVEAARAQGSGLSGVFARLELKLNPFHSAPWADALVVCHITPEQPISHPIPWTRDLPTGGERDWVFMVELDRATEPLATIGGKAREYATMMADKRWRRHWEERFGKRQPRILWVVPDARRCTQVQKVWQEVWPGGQWYITTFEELRNNYWQRFRAGERGVVQFFTPPMPAAGSSGQAMTSGAGALQGTQGANATPQTIGAAGVPAVQPSAAATTARTLRVGLLLTSGYQTIAANDRRVQLLDAGGRVVSEATLQLGRAQLSLPVSEQAVRLRVPELRVEVALGAGRDTIDLKLPEPPPSPPPAPDPRFERQPGDEPRQWGDAAFERVIDDAYHACAALSRRVNRQCDERTQRAIDEGGAGQIVVGLLLAYLSIFPVGLCVLGQALCVLLRGLVRLGRAVGWMLGTVWDCAWGKPEHGVLTMLARTLLALALGMWLPLASWAYYDGELRSWPCESYMIGISLYAFPTPGIQQQPVTVQPGSELRCFTQTVRDERTTWRRVVADDRELWVEDRLLVRKEGL